ncbi:DUF5107 domain-containing protein [Pelagicoccus mobilis]|uniref:DUF5107 domain-containing protein n=1 Tax=Pelagicoccus mobilis TaxID=415221 RepID=A0A934VN74_9BACT|nr:DUF5107 domain-containing protein [Pelagicoccus mobilis]MBK1875932.1 DUF5107 domain-containing protein [Pelagicoccus mobilis]
MKTTEAKREPLVIPTYGLGAPEKNPLFFEKRVYQGSCGKVYPVPFIDKVFDTPDPKAYDSVRLENEYVRLVMLPEIGGRIFLGQDKVNNDYDFFYRQNEIKPALVGLAGPWISGGVEFNWPQHHRPGTYMPTDVHIEEEGDGARTVWMSEHDPINRMKGMHGIRLRPDSALVELKARLYNRTPFTQTFLWWANVAAEVHDNFQSFFPPDVHYVADHAVRAQSSFPIANNDYYGVDYASRAGANDISWYKNIPVPTSYMVCDTKFSFFGGYDYNAQGGFIHVADINISPGKKQWTWGNHEFGWAWDRELTDRVGATGRPAPYVELMAGVYTDNQPDFSYLQPYETKTFSQFWWPYKKIGPVQNANKDAALRLVLSDEGTLDLGAVVSRKMEGVRILLRERDKVLIDERVDLSPEDPWQNQSLRFEGEDIGDLELSIENVITYRPIDASQLERKREVATEPASPEETETIEELYLTAEHLEQYRHPTRYPELYWDEALKRDPQDARTNIAYGRSKLKRGLLEEAVTHFETAIKRLTHRHPNPCTSEAHYFLGVTLRFLGRFEEAYAALFKATWNYEWRSAGYYELAQIDCSRGRYESALEHCDCALDTNRQFNKAIILKSIVLGKLGRTSEGLLDSLLEVDPLDHWARYVSEDIEGFLLKSRNDAQTVLDVAYDFADAGLIEEAIAVLELHHSRSVTEVAVPNPLQESQLTHYVLAWLKKDKEALKAASRLKSDYLFPSRLHDQLVLEWALGVNPEDSNAAYGLGNYYFDRKRHEEAIAAWEQASRVSPKFATVHRNLGIAYWNIRRDVEAARVAYARAVECDPSDARLWAEFDQLKAKLGDPVEERLQCLLERPDLVSQRDDCTVALAELYNETGQPELALDILLNRRFHPWEGGEGKVLRQYTTARLLIGQRALNTGDAEEALEQFELAMQPPQNLGEAYHLLQAKADVSYWTGMALRALGREEEAVAQFETSANEAGDFQAMAVTEHSELSFYRGLSLKELGREAEAEALFEDMKSFAVRERKKSAQVDYFATSLPLLLVFEDDLNETRQREMNELIRLTEEGLEKVEGEKLV